MYCISGIYKLSFTLLCRVLIIIVSVYPMYGQDNTVVLVEPEINANLFQKNIHFRWTSEGKITRFQLSQDKEFDKKVVDTLISTQSLLIKQLKPCNEYYWRVIPKDTLCEYDQYSYGFFKTTAIQMDEEASEEDLPIQIIATHINGNEVIFFDNPDELAFEISILNEKKGKSLYYRCDTEKKGIPTKNWPRGIYDIKITIEDNTSYTKYITLH